MVTLMMHSEEKMETVEIVREEVEGKREGKMGDTLESTMNSTSHLYINSVSGGVRTPEEDGEDTKKEANLTSDVSVKSTEDSSSVQEETEEDEEEKKKREKKIAERLCTVCKEKEGIYRCSRCLQRTCSLVCYKAHEKQKRENQRNLLPSPSPASHLASHQTEKKHGEAKALSNKSEEEERERSAGKKDRQGPQAEDAETRKDVSLSESSSSSSISFSSSSSASLSSPCPLIRRRVEAVKNLRAFDDQVFLKDYRLLEEASRAVEAAARQWKIDAEDCAQKSKRRSVSPSSHFSLSFSLAFSLTNTALFFSPVFRLKIHFSWISAFIFCFLSSS